MPELPVREPPRPELRLMARFTVELTGPLWDLGPTTALGRRRIVPITGGRFEGPLLNGEILDNGADWQVVADDGSTVVDTRYLLRTDDGALVYLRTHGYRHGPPEVLARLTAGEEVDPTDYYFRIHLNFETASADHAWLNHAVAVGSALRLPDAVVYDAYLVA
jgi:Protein of unknown function (DUF3237)